MNTLITAGECVARVSNTGATLTDWSLNDQNVIFPFQFVGEKQRGGIPICCPFFGSTPKNFEGISQHGWLRDVEMISHIERQNKVTTHNTYNGENEKYPWKFMTSSDHEILTSPIENLLDVRLELYRPDENNGRMPLNLAFHPYFVSYGKRDVHVNGRKYVVDVSPKAKCIHIDSNYDIIIDTGKFCINMVLSGFDYDTCLYLWGDAKEYFCIEPVLTSPTHFNTSRGVWLKGKHSMEISMRLSII